MTDSLFSVLPISPAFVANLTAMGYVEMTPIQAQSLPPVLAGKDVKAQAKTGSGKTAAFGIGLLHKLNAEQYQTQALVLCPTRELADQVSKELRRLAKAINNIKITTLCGGVAFGPQLASLEHPPHVVVGTPGRLLKHLQKGSLQLDNVQTLVLDEADRMLDMGFEEDIQRIIAGTPDNRQTLLFSATYPEEIEGISLAVQREPVNVIVESQHAANVIRQEFFEVDQHAKEQALVNLLLHFQPESCVVFCNRKQQCQDLCNELRRYGFQALAIHGDLEQKDRDQVLVQFNNKSITILIATDVAARGLDIKELSAVINFELPHDPEIYVHRIGRTGRAGNEGLALSVYAPSEVRKVQGVEQYQKSKATVSKIPVAGNQIADIPKAEMVTLSINAGRKNKMRAGDILGALTAQSDLTRDDIGKIDIGEFFSYVAVKRPVHKQALKLLSESKVKGRQYRARKL